MLIEISVTSNNTSHRNHTWQAHHAFGSWAQTFSKAPKVSFWLSEPQRSIHVFVWFIQRCQKAWERQTTCWVGALWVFFDNICGCTVPLYLVSFAGPWWRGAGVTYFLLASYGLLLPVFHSSSWSSGYHVLAGDARWISQDDRGLQLQGPGPN